MNPKNQPAESQAAQRIRAKWVLAAATLASSMAFIDGTAVTVALPALQSAFHASSTEIQWIVEAYALFLASLILVGGALGDLFGRRLIFILGVALFTVASIGCGFASSVDFLIAARTLQGIGAALLLPGCLSLISAAYPPETRGKAIGIWSGFSAITAAVGPVLGGWLVDHATWRWVFLLNLPIALAILVIAVWRIPESRNEHVHTLDWPGAALATVGLAAVTFALLEGHRPGLIVPLAAVVGVLCLGLLFIVELRSKTPMIPLNLFRSPTFTGANLITLFLYTALNGLLFYFPINLIQVQHDSATGAGAALLPLILMLFALSKWSGNLIGKYGARLPLTIGPLVAAVGFALAARPGVGDSYWTGFFPAVTVLGFGMAISVAPLTTSVMNSVSVAQAGTASGINNAISRLASLLAVASFGLVLQLAFFQHLERSLTQLNISPAARQHVLDQRAALAAIQTTDPRIQHAVAEAFVFGFRRIIWVAVALCIASAISAQILDPNPPNHTPQA